jgi:hypothetical protein
MEKVLGVVFLVLAACNTQGGADDCGDDCEEICGPCGSVLAGDDYITGDFRLDGVFRAVVELGRATAGIETSFRADLEALAAAFGVQGAAGMPTADLADEVRSAIDAAIDASISGGLAIDFIPPRCLAGANAARSAQAACESKAGCEVSEDCETDVSLPFACAGTCSGACSGTCEGRCYAPISGEQCGGTCLGACDLEDAASCTGICRGTCAGSCSLYDQTGTCWGICEGNCQGTCELVTGGSCSGSCTGLCSPAGFSGSCEGRCEGGCDGECSGECEGQLTPSSCNSEGACEATADCQPLASLVGSARTTCSAPVVDIRYELDTDLDPSARAAFAAKMAVLRVRMVGVLRDLFRMRAVVDSDYAAELGFDPPVAQLSQAIEALIGADLESYDIAPGRMACVTPAFEESAQILTDVADDLVVLVEAQLEIAGALDIF